MRSLGVRACIWKARRGTTCPRPVTRSASSRAQLLVASPSDTCCIRWTLATVRGVGHESDSHEQRRAEPLILAGVSAAVGVELRPRSLRLDGGARVDVDGVATDESVLVEIFAHQGPLKGGQLHKVARDALKLITLARSQERSRLIIAFGDSDAAACVSGASWLAEALRVWHVEVLVLVLDDDVRAGLRAAQARQVMVNPLRPGGDRNAPGSQREAQ